MPKASAIKEKKPKETPLMQQYNRIKSKYPNALLLFRVGDFYETFGEDAITTADVLGIVLTKRSNGAASEVELAGFPHHALDTYLPKLVRAGHRVAICDQLEDPKVAKKIVKRGVTELVTPGVAVNDKILDHKSNNFLASVHFDKKYTGVAFVDISTGEFLAAQGDVPYIEKLLQSFSPTEIIFSKSAQKEFKKQFGPDHYTYPLENWIYTKDYTYDLLVKHFETNSLKGFGIEELETGIIAAGAALHYLNEAEHSNIKHISSLARIEEERYVWLDKFSIRNLELLYSLNPGGASLLQVLDKTISPMGARMMKRWIALPLKEQKLIEERQEVVSGFIKDQELNKTLCSYIKQIGDMERLISKAPLGKINPREVLQLKKALQAIEPIKKCCAGSGNEFLTKIADQLNPCSFIREKIEKELAPDPPALINKGNAIADGVNKELDELRNITRSGKEYILELQQREVKQTGISSLKVGFNNVFGYYLEVTHTHKNKVPESWIRKQTLTNAERYITQELKEYEQKIMGAEEKILLLEQRLFNELVISIQDYIQPIQLNANLIARLDCLLSFANVSLKNNYRKPEINNSLSIDIKEGRHPVIEQQLQIGEEYVPNDIYLDNEEQQIIIITGPNMSGKSALLRQTALIVLMAQTGCFVPAASAKIGLVDKVFTRVGASDNISSGESTFMVEMNETASIVNNISERSLILLDEIGRGTSTYDGISLAWSIAEYLHNNPQAQPKTLFATHYHELNELAEKLPRIKNFNVATKEAGQKVIFLRKLKEGGSKHSFGIHVAKMAGMPKAILSRANEILQELEQKHIGAEMKKNLKKLPPSNYQLSFFQVENPKLAELQKELRKLDINTFTPVEALMKLNDLKKLLEE